MQLVIVDITGPNAVRVKWLEAIVCIILQIFFATCALLKLGEYHSDIPQF